MSLLSLMVLLPWKSLLSSYMSLMVLFPWNSLLSSEHFPHVGRIFLCFASIYIPSEFDRWTRQVGQILRLANLSSLLCVMAKNYVKYRVSLIFVLSVVLQLSFFLPLPTLALGTQCTGPLGPGTADPESPYWFETIKKQ